METYDPSESTAKSNITFIGPAQTVCKDFEELALYSLDQYFPNWWNYDHPRSHMIPPVFDNNNPNKSDYDIEAKRGWQSPSESNVHAPSKLRLADEADHWISKSISRLINDGFKAPFVAFRGFSIYNLYAKGQLLQLFPHLTPAILAEFDICLCQEFDYVLIGPKIGVIVIEVNGSKFEETKHFVPGNRGSLPIDKHGIEQLNLFDEFAKVMQRCDRMALLIWPDNFTIKKIWFTPNIARKRFDDWMQSMHDDGRNYVIAKLQGIERIYQDDLEKVDDIMKLHLSNATPISPTAYELAVTIMGGLQSVALTIVDAEPTPRSEPAKRPLSSSDASSKLVSLNYPAKLPDTATILEKSERNDALSASAMMKLLRGKCVFLTPMQQAALHGPPMQCIIGVAGTGKTLVLQAKALQLLESGQSVCVLATGVYVFKYEKFFRVHGFGEKVNVSAWYIIKRAAKTFCVVSGVVSVDGSNEEENRIILATEKLIESHVDPQTLEIRDFASIRMFQKETEALLSCFKENHSMFIDVTGDRIWDNDASDGYEKLAIVILFTMARRLRPDMTLWTAFDPYADFFEHPKFKFKLHSLGDRGCGIGTSYLTNGMQCAEAAYNLFYRDLANLTKCVSPSLGHKIQERYPDFDYKPLIADLVKKSIITSNEEKTLNEEKDTSEKSSVLFRSILPSKSYEEIIETFNVLRTHFPATGDHQFLNERQAHFTGEFLMESAKRLTDETASFYQLSDSAIKGASPNVWRLVKDFQSGITDYQTKLNAPQAQIVVLLQELIAEVALVTRKMRKRMETTYSSTASAPSDELHDALEKPVGPVVKRLSEVFNRGTVQNLEDAGKKILAQHSVENVGPSSTDVYQNILEYLIENVPDLDYERLVGGLAKNNIISEHEERELIFDSSNPKYQALSLFLTILPTKSLEKIQHSFEILGDHMSDCKSNEFLNEQRRLLEGQHEEKGASGASEYSKDIGKESNKGDLAAMLDKLNEGQLQLVESVEQLIHDIKPILNDLKSLPPPLEIHDIKPILNDLKSLPPPLEIHDIKPILNDLKSLPPPLENQEQITIVKMSSPNFLKSSFILLCRTLPFLCLAVSISTLKQCGDWESVVFHGSQVVLIILMILAIVVTIIKYRRIPPKPIDACEEERQDMRHVSSIMLWLAVLALIAGVSKAAFDIINTIDQSPEHVHWIDCAYSIALCGFLLYIVIYFGLVYGKTHSSAIYDHFLGSVFIMNGIHIISLDVGEILPHYPKLSCNNGGASSEPMSNNSSEYNGNESVHEFTGIVVYSLGVEVMGLAWYILLLWKPSKRHVEFAEMSDRANPAARSFDHLGRVTPVDTVLCIAGTLLVIVSMIILFSLSIIEMRNGENDMTKNDAISIWEMIKYVGMTTYCLVVIFIAEFSADDHRLLSGSYEIPLQRWSTNGSVLSLCALAVASGARFWLLSVKYAANVLEFFAQGAVIYNCMAMKRRLHSNGYSDGRWKMKMRLWIAPLFLSNASYWAYDLFQWRSLLILVTPTSNAAPGLLWIVLTVVFFIVCIYNRFHCILACWGLCSPKMPRVRWHLWWKQRGVVEGGRENVENEDSEF